MFIIWEFREGVEGLTYMGVSMASVLGACRESSLLTTGASHGYIHLREHHTIFFEVESGNGSQRREANGRSNTAHDCRRRDIQTTTATDIGRYSISGKHLAACPCYNTHVRSDLINNSAPSTHREVYPKAIFMSLGRANGVTQNRVQPRTEERHNSRFSPLITLIRGVHLSAIRLL